MPTTATKVKRRAATKASPAHRKQARGTHSTGARTATGTVPAAAGAAANEWFELRRSPIQGRGAFARRDIPRGTRIIEYTGEKISYAEADRRYDDAKMRRHHTFLFTLNSRQIVDAANGGNESMYINHSCDPNCEAIISRGHIWIHALKDIPAGAELAYDYKYEHLDHYTQDDLHFYACRCGSSRCRGTIVAPKAKKAK